MNASARVLLAGTLTVFASIALAQTVPGEAKDQKPLPASIHGWAVHPDGTPLLTVEIEPVRPGGASAVVLVSQKDGSFESKPFTSRSLPPGRESWVEPSTMSSVPEDLLSRNAIHGPGAGD